MPPDAPPKIPGLRVLRCLGRGGMGAVYLVLDEANRALALKVMAGDAVDLFARERFDREIDAVSSIRHANIMRLVKAGVADGAPFALFERVRGRVLSRIGAQPWPVVVELGRQLARATAAVHAAGWIHRDLKRANVMVGDHGLVTLIDFGLAKRWSELEARRRPARPTDATLTQHGFVVGTPRYLAPELRRGRAATPATDVYSLGLVLHELLGGTVDADGRMSDVPVRPPAALSTLVAAALDPDPRHRPHASTVAAVLDMLPASSTILRARPRGDDPTWPISPDRQPTCLDDRSLLRRAG